MFSTLMSRGAPKSIKNAWFLQGLSWGTLGHLPVILTERVAILTWRPRSIQNVHHSAAVCSFSWNRCRDGPENLDKTKVFEGFPKRAPLCSRLLILPWFDAPRRVQQLIEVSKKRTTLQPFAHFRHIALAISHRSETSKFQHKLSVLPVKLVLELVIQLRRKI